MVASSFIKIFSIFVLAALSVSAQGDCPSIQAEDNNTEKKRFIVILDKEVKNAVKDHYETLKGCYNTRVQNIINVDESDITEFDQNTIRDFSVDGSIQGYTSYFTPEFANAVEKMKNVLIVEEESDIKEDAPQHFNKRYSINRRTEDDHPTPNVDRIDQAKRPLDGKFIYPDSAGKGVNIYIIDSGIYLEHDEFGGRAKFGRSFCKGCSKEFMSYHGTFVASVAAGRTVGVARKANLIDVRVFNEKTQGKTSDMIEALSYIIDQHKNGKNKNSVVNMSIRVVPVSRALLHAVKEVTDAGIHVAVSAGNESKESCKQSPAAAPSAITVGATDFKNDSITDFSNFGKCVDIFAPGLNITGAGLDSKHDYLKGYWGTSFSSPLVAGTLALLISKNGNKPPAELTKDLINLSTKGVVIGIKDKKGTPNTFLRTPAS
ncbi:10858_t:CDS:1 [Funneliformis caledonium]|uniref:10858_t:CDS:1 n=1 Tax=Funneliformis caledonium TaxID=1117310 RepID=A0A9N9I0R7_9GLOM|nr:10858_t:CDS:1 [Funneliformis caledonium]